VTAADDDGRRSTAATVTEPGTMTSGGGGNGNGEVKAMAVKIFI